MNLNTATFSRTITREDAQDVVRRTGSDDEFVFSDEQWANFKSRYEGGPNDFDDDIANDFIERDID